MPARPGVRTPARIDWLGNVTFAIGLVLVLAGITYGVLPYHGKSMGWTNPEVIGAIAGGVLVLILFGFIETRVAQPMFRLSLFRIRAFTAGNVASFLASLSRGGLMFMPSSGCRASGCRCTATASRGHRCGPGST